ncbi:MAG TPA: serine hydrolase domain-containing protein, partial [Solimonas sp.]
GVMGALLAILVDRGLLEPQAPVSRYWPEFAAAGKAAITVAQLFSHQAGLPLLDANQSLALAADREALARALAAQAPLWRPGSAHGYHAITLGNYADILFERASGKGMCALLAEFAPQMGAEVYCGLPREHWHRAVRVLPALPPATPAAAPAIEPGSLPFRVITNMPEYLGNPQAFFNGEGIRQVCLPGTNMFSNARSLARLYAGLLAGGIWNGQRLCSPEAIATVTTERVRGMDLVNNAEMAYGLAFQKPCQFSPFSPNRAAYGHCGVGGSAAFADPDRGLTMAWIPSRFSAQSFDRRAQAVIDAVYAAL